MADLARPELTLPPKEAEAVRAAYSEAKVILEYGTGGSTVMAAEMPGKVVFAVESDREWLSGLLGWFEHHPPRSAVHLVHADIGPTGAWGHPVGAADRRRWKSYPLSVWKRPDFQHPDVVLVDGRFRVACFLTVMRLIRRSVRVLFDDYARREAYHVVEAFVAPVAQIGRLAVFHLDPRPLSTEARSLLQKSYRRPL